MIAGRISSLTARTRTASSRAPRSRMEMDPNTAPEDEGGHRYGGLAEKSRGVEHR